MPDARSTPTSNGPDLLRIAFAGCVIALLLVVSVPLGLAYLAQELALRFAFMRSARRGRFILFVYSDSSKWKAYIEANLLAYIQDYAVVLNWSERKRWDNASWPVRAFEHWGGHKDFNPLAVVFLGLTRVRVLRFYQAFKDFKHGKEAALLAVESELLELARANTRPS